MKRLPAFCCALNKILFVLLATVALAPLSDAQTAQRSGYSAGSVSYGRFVMNTDMVADRFVYHEDVNGDGYTDVIVTAYSPTDRPAQGALPGHILLNNGDNTFRLAGGDRPQSEWVREVLVADFNNDGFPDIFFADHGWDAYPFPGFRNQLLLGNGDSFIDATNRLPAIADFSHNAAVGDINGDGHIDILVNNPAQGDGTKASYFLINRGDANFDLDRTRLPQSFVRVADNQYSWAAELDDLDNDGFPDLIIGRKQGAQGLPTRVYWNPGNGDFSNAPVTNLPDLTRFTAPGNYEVIEIKAFDVDADGYRDLMISAYSSAFRGTGIQLLSNRGNRQFVDSTDVCLSGITQDPSPERDTPYYFRKVDVNFDGVPDIVALKNGDASPQTTLFFEGSGGRFRAIARENLGGDTEAQVRLRWGQPVVGDGVLGYADVYVLEENGQRKLGINYLPVSSTPMPAVANRFDVCTNQMSSIVDAGDLGRIQLKFNLLRMEPTVRIQALASTLKDISNLPAKFATFSNSSGLLMVPELAIDDAVGYRGLRFQLIDGENLIFELVGAD
ncbi:MAG: VCBS repeat-containing protein [Pseudohongiella sp.]|nr:VCBS repeat-containing protein [Pseudohongiella sp.]